MDYPEQYATSTECRKACGAPNRPISKSQFEYIVKSRHLPHVRRVGPVRLWPRDVLPAFRAAAAEIDKSRTIRGGRPPKCRSIAA